MLGQRNAGSNPNHSLTMWAVDSLPCRLSKEWTKYLFNLSGVEVAPPNWLVRHKKDLHVVVMEDRKFKINLWAENHHSPLNWDVLATVSDKDRCWGRQTWFMTLCFILSGSSTFQAEEFHFKGKDSSQCMASSGKTKTTSVTSTNRYPLFVTYLLREYLTSQSNYLKIYFSCHIN